MKGAVETPGELRWIINSKNVISISLLLLITINLSLEYLHNKQSN